MVKKNSFLPIFLLLVWILMPRVISAQILYDKARDDQAQQAKKLAEALTSGSLFDKELKNLAFLSKQDFATHFLRTRTTARAQIDGFLTWNDVDLHINTLKASLAVSNLQPSAQQIQAKLDEVKAKIEAAKGALEKLKEKACDDGGNGDAGAQGSRDANENKKDCKNQTLSMLFEHLGDFKALNDLAQKLADQKTLDLSRVLNPNTLNALGEIAAILDPIDKLYKSYTERVKSFNDLKGKLAELRVPLKKVALQRLQLEEQHWKTVAAIRARREADEGDIKLLIQDYDVIRSRIVGYRWFNRNISIAQMFNAAIDNSNPKSMDDRDQVADLLLALYDAAALAARGSSPDNLADLRLAQEEHAYSIRKSAMMARAYELTVSTGAQRLALYHAGGIKPEQIARLVHSAVTAGIIPAILVQ